MNLLIDVGAINAENCQVSSEIQRFEGDIGEFLGILK